MKLTPILTSFAIIVLAQLASAADAPTPTPADATTAPATTVSVPAIGPTSSPDIPTPLTTGQVITLFPEGVPGWKDIGPEQVTANGGTFTNISKPRMIVGFPPAGTPQNGTAIIFCAGGGYVHVALGNGMNSLLNPLGVTTFNLIYRCKEFGAPAPQQDVLRAVRLVRAHAKEFGINPDRIGVMGDSAGSHVAGSAATLYDDPIGKTGSPLDQVSARPDFAILLFSVLTMEAPNAHAASKENLIGPNPSQELIDHYSLEKHVTHDTPPTFLVHTQGDTTVKEENELMFYAALRKNNVPSELHLYSYGPHGSGIGAAYGDGTIWPKLCEEWMRYNNWLPQSPTSLMPQGLTITSGGARGGRGGRGRGGPPAASAASADATPAATAPAVPASPAATGN